MLTKLSILMSFGSPGETNSLGFASMAKFASRPPSIHGTFLEYQKHPGCLLSSFNARFLEKDDTLASLS